MSLFTAQGQSAFTQTLFLKYLEDQHHSLPPPVMVVDFLADTLLCDTAEPPKKLSQTVLRVYSPPLKWKM